jgi:hypothetical protein
MSATRAPISGYLIVERRDISIAADREQAGRGRSRPFRTAVRADVVASFAESGNGMDFAVTRRSRPSAGPHLEGPSTLWPIRSYVYVGTMSRWSPLGGTSPVAEKCLLCQDPCRAT